MPLFKVSHTQKVLSVYYVTAEDESEAEDKVMAGEFDQCDVEDEVIDGECDTELVKVEEAAA